MSIPGWLWTSGRRRSRQRSPGSLSKSNWDLTFNWHIIFPLSSQILFSFKIYNFIPSPTGSYAPRQNRLHGPPAHPLLESSQRPSRRGERRGASSVRRGQRTGLMGWNVPESRCVNSGQTTGSGGKSVVKAPVAEGTWGEGQEVCPSSGPPPIPGDQRSVWDDPRAHYWGTAGTRPQGPLLAGILHCQVLTNIHGRNSPILQNLLWNGKKGVQLTL